MIIRCPDCKADQSYIRVVNTQETIYEVVLDSYNNLVEGPAVDEDEESFYRCINCCLESPRDYLFMVVGS